jgi:ABC-2 type transport system ATP-binding protein
MPVDRPRRAFLEEPDDVESYVARRSLGFTPADSGDQIAARPERAARAFESAVTTQEVAESDHPRLPDRAPRPRRASLAEAAQRYESAAPAAPFPFESSPQPRRSAPSPSVEPEHAATPPATPVPPAPPPPRVAQPVATSPSMPPPVAIPPIPPPVATSPIPPPPAPIAQSGTNPAAWAALPSAPPEPSLAQPSVQRRAAAAAVRRTRPSRRTVDHEVPPIIVDRLIKSYHGSLAVHNLSFVVKPGRVTGFLGPNGAGKTTTLRIIVGLTTPTTGTATFGDLTYAELPNPLQTVGCVLDASFHPARSGRNHLRVLAPTAGATDRRVDRLLAEVGLGEVARQPVGEYSLGMRQRLALAAALLGKPDYLILDEPANGLDPDGIRWLRTFLRDFAASGRAVLISSHLLNEIEATADDIVVINGGRLVAQMPMSGLNLGEGTTRARVSDVTAALQVLAAIGADVQTAADEQGAYLRIHSHDVGEVASVIFNSGIVVDELITERRDLEQEFFSMLEGSR